MLPALRHDPHNSLSAVSEPDLHPELELLQITFAHALIRVMRCYLNNRTQTKENDKATVRGKIYNCDLKSDGEQHK